MSVNAEYNGLPRWLQPDAPVGWQLALTVVLISAAVLGALVGAAVLLGGAVDSTHPVAYCIGANRTYVPVYRTDFDPKHPGPLLYDCKATKWAPKH